jgi:hypothetical protein
MSAIYCAEEKITIRFNDIVPVAACIYLLNEAACQDEKKVTGLT